MRERYFALSVSYQPDHLERRHQKNLRTEWKVCHTLIMVGGGPGANYSHGTSNTSNLDTSRAVLCQSVKKTHWEKDYKPPLWITIVY